MTINTSSLGGGGGFVTRSISTPQVVSTGASGTLFTITPASNQKARITFLASAAGQINISITIAGVDIITAKTLSSGPNNTANHFMIASSPLASSTSANVHQHITGEVGEAIAVVLTTGTTGSDTRYSYELGQ